jgi:hypothetical protein
MAARRPLKIEEITPMTFYSKAPAAIAFAAVLAIAAQVGAHAQSAEQLNGQEMNRLSTAVPAQSARPPMAYAAAPAGLAPAQGAYPPAAPAAAYPYAYSQPYYGYPNAYYPNPYYADPYAYYGDGYGYPYYGGYPVGFAFGCCGGFRGGFHHSGFHGGGFHGGGFHGGGGRGGGGGGHRH